MLNAFRPYRLFYIHTLQYDTLEIKNKLITAFTHRYAIIQEL